MTRLGQVTKRMVRRIKAQWWVVETSQRGSDDNDIGSARGRLPPEDRGRIEHGSCGSDPLELGSKVTK